MQIEKIVCDYYGLPVAVINEKSRRREKVQARQISMYFYKLYTKYSLTTIGEKVGNKDHATVLHANKTVNNLIETNKHFKTEINELKERITEAQRMDIEAKQRKAKTNRYKLLKTCQNCKLWTI